MTKPTIKKKGAKDEAPAFDRRAIALATAQRINEELKDPYAVQSAEEFVNLFKLRRPTRLTSLDLACAGGIPFSGITQIIGKKSGGKNFLANSVISEVQRTYGEEAVIGIVSLETAYDKGYAKKCGVRVAYTEEEITWEREARRLRGYPDLTEEQIAQMRDQVGLVHQCFRQTAEEAFKVANLWIASNAYQVVLIDSIGALYTEDEAEKDFDEASRPGGEAKLVTRWVKEAQSLLNRRDAYGRHNTTSVLVINQYREKIGGQGDPMAQGGGNALQHGKLLDILVTSGANIPLKGEGTKPDEDNPIVGKAIHWKIIKGKAGCHDGPFGSYKFYYGENGYGFGADIYQDLINSGLQTGVIERSGAWYSLASGERLGQGAVNAAAAIHQQGLFDTIRDQIFREAGVAFLSKENF